MNLIPWHSKRSAGDGADLAERETDIRREIARAFDRFFSDPSAPLGGVSELMTLGGSRLGEFIPASDVTESDTEVTVKAELAGVDPKDVDVTVSGNVLSLSGEKEESHEDQGADFYRSERSFGSFRRRIELPESVDPDNVSASYDNGVLSIRLAKKQDVRPRKIPVSGR